MSEFDKLSTMSSENVSVNENAENDEEQEDEDETSEMHSEKDQESMAASKSSRIPSAETMVESPPKSPPITKTKSSTGEIRTKLDSLDKSLQKLVSLSSEKVKSEKSKDRFSTLHQRTLGSVIDVRKMSVTGDIGERRTARYMNTYRMEAENPFNTEKVDKILKKVMEEALENLDYDLDKCPKQAKWASSVIRSKVKKMNFDRYKIICVVSIGEKHSQDVFATCRFLWDTEKDRYSVYSMENTYVYGYAQCFGLYYE
ncbi:hypothetical protein JTB14_008871 [Gonioctena quinquepunctata]|nr:hypothetical protein JTB14_008871 [Gonioctena quinquepunctata]